MFACGLFSSDALRRLAQQVKNFKSFPKFMDKHLRNPPNFNRQTFTKLHQNLPSSIKSTEKYSRKSIYNTLGHVIPDLTLFGTVSPRDHDTDTPSIAVSPLAHDWLPLHDPVKLDLAANATVYCDRGGAAVAPPNHGTVILVLTATSTLGHDNVKTLHDNIKTLLQRLTTVHCGCRARPHGPSKPVSQV